MKTVGLFGFSANPPTGEGGHVGIVRWVLEAPLRELGGENVDEVWVLPVARHPFPEKQAMPGFEHRLEMARIAFEPLERVRVLDVEREVAERVDQPGTIDTLRHLEARCPDHRFVLVLGEDAHRDLRAGRWKESRAVLDEVPVVPIRRPGEPRRGDEAGYEIPSLSEVSSSRVRASTDREWLSDVLPSGVLDYIIRHRLYAFGEDQGA